MGELIGYKGTADERQQAWNTLLKLRKDIKVLSAVKTANVTEQLEMEKDWYQEDFKLYIAA